MTRPHFLSHAILIGVFIGFIHSYEIVGENSDSHVALERVALDIHEVFTHRNRLWMSQILPDVTQNYTNLVRNAQSIKLPEAGLKGGVSSMGQFYATIEVDGQPIRVQVDTGSSTLAVPVKGCVNCGQNALSYNMRKKRWGSGWIRCDSEDCRANACSVVRGCPACGRNGACCSAHAHKYCGFYLSYADSSGAMGGLMQADVKLGPVSEHIKLGGILQTIKNFNAENVDGIIGFAYKNLACNPTCVTPLFDKALESGSVRHDKFSLCLSENGGSMTLGGNNPSEYQGSLKYTPMVEREYKAFYEVKVDRVLFNGEQKSIPNMRGGIVDSGTTLLVVSGPTFLELKHYFQSNFCDVPGICPPRSWRRTLRRNFVHVKTPQTTQEFNTYNREASIFSHGTCRKAEYMSDFLLSRLPKITLVLDGNVNVELGHEEYLIKYCEKSGFWFFQQTRCYYCLGIAPLEGLEKQGFDMIIGDVVLQKYYHEVDRENSRIGFAERTECKPNIYTTRVPKTKQMIRSPVSINALIGASILLVLGFSYFAWLRLRNRTEYSAVGN